MALRIFSNCLTKNIRNASGTLSANSCWSQPTRTKISRAAEEKFGLPDEDVTKKMYDGRSKTKLELQGLDLSKYTHKAIPYPKTGGRHQDGRIGNRRIGGGDRQKFRMLDYTRTAISKDKDLVEKVLSVRYDPLRSANIALVGRGNHKRWIVASESMKTGQLIRSSAKIPDIPVKFKEGDAHPVGAMPSGSVVHNIEKFVGKGGLVARAAGSCGIMLRKMDDMCIIKMPSKREMAISPECIATFGKPSNVEVNARPIGSAQRNRWFGVRPKSGLWHKKTGYNGRKIKPIKPRVIYKTEKSQTGWLDS